MQEAKGPKTNLIFDLTDPSREMFIRHLEELPTFAVLATHPDPTVVVQEAQVKILKTLTKLIADADNNIISMQQTAIEMESGQVMTLTPDSVVLSLMYDKGKSKLIQIELADPNEITFH
jgi:hypothetical protein